MVVAEAVRAQAQLAAMGEDVSFAVNLSAHAFNDSELLTFLADLLRDTGLDPKRLILEMTETATVADFGAAHSLVEAIRGLGCSFALDDFRRGFASFFYLKELPMEYVKIDGSFVRNLLERPDDQALVRAMGQIARPSERRPWPSTWSPARSWSSWRRSTSIMPKATTPAARYP
jgi:EAL domain-containing protein (putative c-di-GMP-specific phosphodiesterase class I)